MTGGARGSIGQVVRAPKTAEVIATHLRGQIVRGSLKPGETLPPESDLMRRLGVSRPTLREAFRILETEALIHVRRGSRGGAQVTAPDMVVAARYVGLLLQLAGTTVADVYEARTILEPACARLLAARALPADIAAMRLVIAELTSTIDGDPDPLRLSVLTYRFHELLMARSGNRTLAVQGGVLQEIIARHVASTIVRNFDAEVTPGYVRTMIRSCSKLVDLIQRHDEDGAEAHWRKHLHAAASGLIGEVGPRTVVELFATPFPG